jgi:ribonuclease T2
MPARNLVIHEYRKHGTCSGLTPEAYYELSRKLYAKVKVPPRFERPNAALTVAPEEIVREFVGVNPQMKPESIAVTCNGPGNRLREIRVCFTREGEFRACGRNEDARRLCGAPKVYIPPVRQSAATPEPRRGGPVPPQGPLPGPAEPSLNNTRGERRI